MNQIGKRFPIYSKLLMLYPKSYRERYSDEIMLTTADMLDDPENSKTAVWIRTVIDYPVSVTKQNLIYIGGTLMNETPNYVKINSIIAAALIMPFFMLIIINSISNHALNFTHSWKQLFVWLLVGLPAAALILTTVTFIKWASDRKSFWKSIFDFRRSWLLLVPGGLALLIVLFVPFHDSTKCIKGNPVRELQHFRQTVSCIQRGN